jgi:multicomponent K+:H+ antiporter subunit A
MSLIAMLGGGVLYLALRKYLQTAESGPGILGRLDAQRIFERLPMPNKHIPLNANIRKVA